MPCEEEGKKEVVAAAPLVGNQPFHAGERFGEEIFTRQSEEEFQKSIG